MFPDSNPVFDLSGVAFTLATASPLGDGTTSNVVTIKGSSTTTYYEQTAQGAAQNSVVSLLTFGPYVQNTPPPNCTAVSGAAAVASSYSFCYKVYDTNFTSFITGLLTINPLSAGQAGSPLQTYWTVLSLTGTRTFTDLTTGVTTVSTITNLLPIGSIGGNDNRLYLNSAILLDGDGISVQLDNIPPIYGQYGAANQTKTMNLWYTNGNFEEETVSGTREGPRDTLQSSFTVTPAAVGSPYPVCTNALNVTYYLCAVLQASSYVSVDQATLVVNSTSLTHNDYNGVSSTAYRVVGITSGSRSYTDLTAVSPVQQVVQMKNLSPTGSTGGNDNLFYPGTLPQQLDGDGLTFDFVDKVNVFGRTNGTQMNLWWASGSNSLLEEVSGGTHPPTPLQSTLVISQTPVTCSVPTYAQFHMCLYIIGNGYTSLISAYVNTTGVAARIAPTAANGLTSAAQGWTVVSVSQATRVFTNTITGASSTSTLTGVAAVNSVSGNDNMSAHRTLIDGLHQPELSTLVLLVRPLTSVSVVCCLSSLSASSLTPPVCPSSICRVWPSLCRVVPCWVMVLCPPCCPSALRLPACTTSRAPAPRRRRPCPTSPPRCTSRASLPPCAAPPPALLRPRPPPTPTAGRCTTPTSPPSYRVFSPSTPCPQEWPALPTFPTGRSCR